MGGRVRVCTVRLRRIGGASRWPSPVTSCSFSAFFAKCSTPYVPVKASGSTISSAPSPAARRISSLARDRLCARSAATLSWITAARRDTMDRKPTHPRSVPRQEFFFHAKPGPLHEMRLLLAAAAASLSVPVSAWCPATPPRIVSSQQAALLSCRSRSFSRIRPGWSRSSAATTDDAAGAPTTGATEVAVFSRG